METRYNGFELNVAIQAVTRKGKILSPGETATYLAHLPGGEVIIRFPDETEDHAPAYCFKQFRD